MLTKEPYADLYEGFYMKINAMNSGAQAMVERTRNKAYGYCWAMEDIGAIDHLEESVKIEAAWRFSYAYCVHLMEHFYEHTLSIQAAFKQWSEEGIIDSH